MIKQSWFSGALAVLVVLLLAGQNFILLKIGSPDFIAYRIWYDSLWTLPLAEGWQFHNDKGYVLLNLFFATLTPLDFDQFIKFITYVAQISLLYPVLKLSKKIPRDTVLSLILILFFSFIHVDHLTHYLRQNLAMAALVLSLIMRRGPWQLGLGLLASSLHSSTALFVIGSAIVDVYFSWRNKSERNWNLATLILNSIYYLVNKFALVRLAHFGRIKYDYFLNWEYIFFWIVSLLVLIFLLRDKKNTYLLSQDIRLRVGAIITIWVLVKIPLIPYYGAAIQWDHYSIMTMPMFILIALPKTLMPWQRMSLVAGAFLSVLYFYI